MSTPPVSFAPPWWTYGLSDPLRAGGSHDGDTSPQDDDDDEAEVDGAEKSDDSGPDHGGGSASPYLWVEL